METASSLNRTISSISFRSCARRGITKTEIACSVHCGQGPESSSASTLRALCRVMKETGGKAKQCPSCLHTREGLCFSLGHRSASNSKFTGLFMGENIEMLGSLVPCVNRLPRFFQCTLQNGIHYL